MAALRQRLRSEVWRHTVAGAVIGLLIIASQLLVTAAPEDSATRWSVLFAILLSAAGLYGPLFLWLSRFAWRGVRGAAFRHALQATQPPNRRLVRGLLIGGPTYWAVSAAVVSLLAVGVLAMSAQLTVAPYLVAASLLCVSGSWILVVASFAVEYAREWATSDGLRFPGDDPDQRTFGDFIYAAVQVSTTFSSSDVAVVNQRARRLVTVNSLTAFGFSTVIIALVVALVLTGVTR